MDSFSRGLAEGRCLVIFPEGTSHNSTDVWICKSLYWWFKVLDFKAGFAKAAFGTFKYKEDAVVTIVPVGLNYDAKNRFRRFVNFESIVDVI